jgi:hypothetical protein
MSIFVILFRNTSNQRVGFVSFDDRGELAVFASREEAETAAHDVPICQGYPYQIVEADEL